MTPTTGLAAEGLLRQLLPSAVGLVGFIVFVLVVLWVFRSFAAKAQTADGLSVEETEYSVGWAGWTARVLIVLAGVAFIWNAISVVTANRTPRSDLDGTAVYEQMKKNIKPSE
jgi:hypothetical protein